jgi:peptide/nickel transport system substrate-binding protein
LERTRRGAALLALLTILALVAAACGGGGDDDNKSDDGAGTGKTTETTEEAKAEVQDGGTLTYASDQKVAGFNNGTSADNKASLQYIVINVYPQPFRTTPDFEVVPDPNYLTSAKQVKDDPQTVELKINPKAVWSDGTPISADDFIWNWQAQNGTNKDIDVATTTGYEDIGSVTGSDGGKTVTIEFKKPFADWKALFGNLLPKHLMEQTAPGDVAKQWNEGLANFPTWSGGPFKIASYTKDQTLTLVPNDKWWGEKPHLDQLVVRFGIDTGAVPQALQNKEIDLAYPQPQIDLVQKIKAVPGVKAEIAYGLSYEHIDFNFHNEHLAVKEVRQAIAYALDRDDIVNRTVKQFDDGGKRLDNRIWLTGQPEYEAHGKDYAKKNVAKAEELLKKAGYVKGSDGIYAKDGKKLSLRIGTTGGNALREQTEQLIQSQLKAAGIDIKIENVDGSAIFDEFDVGNFDIALFAWVGTPFSVSSNKAIFSCTESDEGPCDGGSNFGAYSNPKVEELFTQAIATADKDESIKLSQQIDEILWDDMATVPLYAKPVYQPYRDTFGNVKINATTEGPIWNAAEIGVKKA